MKTSLIRQLSEYGVTVIQSDGKNKVTLPWPPEQAPAEVIPLLKKLKASANVKTWDEDLALSLFEESMERLRRHYPAGAIPWANESRPELMDVMHGAARRYNKAFQNQNLAGCRQTVAVYEQAAMNLFVTFKENEA